MANPTKELGALARALEAFSEGDRDMPLYRAMILIEIATHPGVKMTEIEERLGLSQGAISRNMSVLTEWKKFGEPGLNLVVTAPDPTYPNRKICFLTAKGKRRMEKVLSHMLERDVSLDAHNPSEFIKRAHASANLEE